MDQPTKFVPSAVPISPTGLQNLVVITVISNPVRYGSRYKLYSKFAEVMKQAGATLITVEQAFGERPFIVTDKSNPFHLQVRSLDELWHKENMIQLGINYACQLLPDTKYFAWIDADVLPMRPVREWLEETVHSLQHYHFVQMFRTAIDLDPGHNMIGTPAHSFMSKYLTSNYKEPDRAGFWKNAYYDHHGHPGYAWAATREGLEGVGGLIEFAILGAADRHMAYGLIGCMDKTFEALNADYVRALMQWQERAERWVKRDVGFVDGSIFHFWHGKKKDRGYTDRWKILRDNDYDPTQDLKRDSQGLLVLETWSPRQIRLRDHLRSYFRSRNEDSVDV